MSVDELRDILHVKYPAMEAVPIRHRDLVFEERVRLKCFHCRNYQTKWTCPGKLPQFDFRKIIGEYDQMAVVINRQSNVSEAEGMKEAYRKVGNELHEALLHLEAELMKRNNPLAQSFIGGYCDLCKDGCPADKCANPEQARVSWDATGCNIVRSLANIGIHVVFGGKDVCRYGLILW